MDLISTLSDDLLQKILSSSSLPTNDVVSTMLLSKRWKSLWTMVPTLDFRILQGRLRQVSATRLPVHGSPQVSRPRNLEAQTQLVLLFLSEDMMPEMVVANVNVVYKSPEMLMRSFTSVKRLSLCLTTSMIQHRIEFNQLVHLELCSSGEKWCELLNWMLESSPKLEFLKLNKCKVHSFAMTKHIEFPWRIPSAVPECLKYHLYTFEWNYYNGCREEKEMVAYILGHAKLLKIAKICMSDMDCEAEPHIFKEWRYFRMASIQSHVSFCLNKNLEAFCLES